MLVKYPKETEVRVSQWYLYIHFHSSITQPKSGVKPNVYIDKWISKVLIYKEYGASQVVLVEKNLPADSGYRDEGLIPGLGRSPGGEVPLVENMTSHSSILAWRIPWTEEPGGLQSIGLQRAGHD